MTHHDPTSGSGVRRLGSGNEETLGVFDLLVLVARAVEFLSDASFVVSDVAVDLVEAPDRPRRLALADARLSDLRSPERRLASLSLVPLTGLRLPNTPGAPLGPEDWPGEGRVSSTSTYTSRTTNPHSGSTTPRSSGRSSCR